MTSATEMPPITKTKMVAPSVSFALDLTPFGASGGTAMRRKAASACGHMGAVQEISHRIKFNIFRAALRFRSTAWGASGERAHQKASTAREQRTDRNRDVLQLVDRFLTHRALQDEAKEWPVYIACKKRISSVCVARAQVSVPEPTSRCGRSHGAPAARKGLHLAHQLFGKSVEEVTPTSPSHAARQQWLSAAQTTAPDTGQEPTDAINFNQESSAN